MSDVGQNNASDDPLDAVSTAAKVWRKAVAAWAERDDLDHAIMRAFESGRTGEEIAAAGGLDIADVYRVHKRIDQIKADDNLDARLAETGRRTAHWQKDSRRTPPTRPLPPSGRPRPGRVRLLIR